MAQSGNITRTPDYVLTDTENVTNAKLNRVGGGTYRVDEGSIGTRELSISVQGGYATVSALRGNTAITFTDGEVVNIRGYYVDGAGDFGPPLYYDESDTTTTDDGLSCFVDANGARFKRTFSGPVNVKWGGAKGDGVTDDYTAIQAVLDLGGPVYVPLGIYIVSDELVFTHGTKMVGDGNYSGVASTYSTQGNSTIRAKSSGFIGGTGSMSCVIRVADDVVGVEPGTVSPSTSSTRDMQNTGIQNIVIDGNQVADIGLYLVRAVSNNNYSYITAMRCKEHAFFVAKSWNGTAQNWMAYKNEKCGITIGKNPWGWSSSTVDQCSFISLFGYFNGYSASSGTYTNNFNDSSAKDVDYGIGYFGGRGNHFSNAQANANGGAGIYLQPAFRPTLFSGGYVENNGLSSGATDAWDIWFEGDAGGISWDVTFDSMHQGGSGPIRLSGVEPSRIEAGVLFRRMGQLNEVKADWGNYRLVDCNRNVIISGVSPRPFIQSVNGDLNILPTGVSYFTATQLTDGAITAGTTTLTSASNPFVGANYGQNVIVLGAGESGSALSSTIASYTGPGEVELTTAATTSVSGATVGFISNTMKEGAILEVQESAIGTYSVQLSEVFDSSGVPVIATTKDNRIVGVTNRVSGFEVYDGVMTATSAALSSSSAPFSSGNVGKYVIVYGAGSGGGSLISRVSSYDSTSVVQLADVASVTVSDATVRLGDTFDITNRTTAGSLTDTNANISVITYGRYV